MLADDMIVTAQEATNKAETVFTIYDDKTNTQIASGPIGGGGGGEGDISITYDLQSDDEKTIQVNILPVEYKIINTFPGQPENQHQFVWNGAFLINFASAPSRDYLCAAYLDDDANPFAQSDVTVQDTMGMALLSVTERTMISAGSHVIKVTVVPR